MQLNSLRKILIANRGEIAVRIIRTCRAIGIESVAVYSDADAHAPHVKAADEAVGIGPAPVTDSYLNGEKMIEAARRTGAGAIHPGYGFLSENADFAAGCQAAGLVFIGPQPDAILKMGLKSAARRIMAAAGVPVVPGYDGGDQSPETLRSEMRKIGFPLMIKASAGGGGKGMRVVRRAEEAQSAIEAAQREAEKAFGNGSLLLEKYIEQARHIEVQILGDRYNNLVHLFERDCSLQRRHQKIIEESPSPAVDPQMRRQLGEAAVTAGKAIGYSNAGTVEFILAPSGEFYFIEVNTRLQVEHPVTEMITGLDLVRLQIEIAEGKSLPFTQPDLRAEGHAIEARLYAEDADNDFLPATGVIIDWRIPSGIDGLRVDSGVERGSEVGIHYDPLLAKLIAHAADRDAALRKLSSALRRLSAPGLTTNRDFLIRLIEHEEFRRGRAHTNFINDRLDELTGVVDQKATRASAVAAALYLQISRQQSGDLIRHIPPAYRNNPYRNPSVRLRTGAEEIEVTWRHIDGDRFEAFVSGESFTLEALSFEPGGLRLSIDGVQRLFRVTEDGDRLYIHSTLGSHVVARVARYPDHDAITEHGAAESPMPGQVLRILVSEGQDIVAGDPLVILEAMKMEQTIRAGADGVVESIRVKAGQVVSPGDVLIQIGVKV